MQQTTNYQLNKPEASDYADIAPISENMDTIDAQLKTAQNHREDGDVHVTGTDKQNWNSKAPGSLSQTVSQLAQDIEDLQDAVSGGSGDLGGLRDDLDSLESTVSGHTGNSAIHVTSSDKSNWNSKAPGSLSATVSNHTGNSGIHVTSTDKEKWNGYGTVHTLTHQGIQSGAQRLTGLNGATGILSCQFKAVNPYTTNSPNFSIDGVTYTPKLQNGETPDSDLFAANAIVSCVVDTSSRTINFKPGGGLSNSRLALANATAADVAEGKTFYAGDKVLKTGTLMPYKYATGTVRISKNESPDVGDTVVTISGIGFRPFIVVVSSYQAVQNYGYWPCMITCVNEINSNTRLVGELAFVGGLTNGYRDAIWHVGMTAQEGSATIKITGQGDPDEVGHFIYPMDCYYYAVGL